MADLSRSRLLIMGDKRIASGLDVDVDVDASGCCEVLPGSADGWRGVRLMMSVLGFRRDGFVAQVFSRTSYMGEIEKDRAVVESWHGQHRIVGSNMRTSRVFASSQMTEPS